MLDYSKGFEHTLLARLTMFAEVQKQTRAAQKGMFALQLDRTFLAKNEMLKRYPATQCRSGRLRNEFHIIIRRPYASGARAYVTQRTKR